MTWTPAEIETALWLDAADSATITETGGAVSVWADKSGNGRDAIGNSSAPPHVDTGVVGIRMEDSFFDVSIPQAQYTYFVVLERSYLDRTQQSIFGAHNGTYIPIAELGDQDANDMRVGRVDVDDVAMRANGAPANQSNSRGDAHALLTAAGQQLIVFDDVPPIGVDALLIGRGDNWDYRFYGLITEIVIAPVGDLLTRQKIEGYLAHKWGIEANLPADHPYKAETPALPPPAAVDATLGATLQDDAAFEAEQVFRGVIDAQPSASVTLDARLAFRGGIASTLDDATLVLEGTNTLSAVLSAALDDAAPTLTANHGVSGALDATYGAVADFAVDHDPGIVLRATLADDTAHFPAHFLLSALLILPRATLSASALAPRAVSGTYLDFPGIDLALSTPVPGVGGGARLPVTVGVEFTVYAPAEVHELRLTSRTLFTKYGTFLSFAPARVFGTIIQPPVQYLDVPEPHYFFARAPCVIGQRKAFGGPAIGQISCASLSVSEFALDRRNNIRTVVFPIELNHPGGFFITEGKGDTVVTDATKLHWGAFWIVSIIQGEGGEDYVDMPADSMGFPVQSVTNYGNIDRATRTPRFTFDGFAAVGFWNTPVRHDYSVNYMAEVPTSLDADITAGDALFYISATYVVSDRLTFWESAKVEGGLLAGLSGFQPAWKPEHGLEVWVDCYDDANTKLGTFSLGTLSENVDQAQDELRTAWTIYKQFRPYPGTRYIRFKWYSYSQGNHADIIERAYTNHYLEGFELFADIHPQDQRRNVVELANPNFDHHTFAGWDVPRYADHHRTPVLAPKTGLDPWGGTASPKEGTLLQRVQLPTQFHPRVDTCDMAATFFVQVYTLGLFTDQEMTADPKFVRFICARAESEIDHFTNNFVDWDFTAGQDFPSWVTDTAPTNDQLFSQVSFSRAKLFKPSAAVTVGDLGWRWQGDATRARWVYLASDANYMRHRATIPPKVSNGNYASPRLRAGEQGSLTFQVDVRIPKQSRWMQIELHFPRFGLIRVSPLYLTNIKNIPPIDVVLAPPMRFSMLSPFVNYLIIKVEVPSVFASFESFAADILAWFFGGAGDHAYIIDEAFARSVTLALEAIGIHDGILADVIYTIRDALQVRATSAASAEMTSFLDERAGLAALALFGLAPRLTEASTFHDVLKLHLGVHARSHLTAGGRLSATVSALAAIGDTCGVGASCAFALSALADEGVTLGDDIDQVAHRAALSAEVIACSDASVTSLQVYRDLVDALVLSDMMRSTFFADAADTVALQSVVQVRQRLKAFGEDYFSASDQARAVFLIDALARDDLQVDETLAASLTAMLSARDGATMLGRVPLEDGEYTMWVV